MQKYVNLELDENKNVIYSGIYILLNTKRNRIYVGKNKNLISRFREHMHLLKSHKHTIKLQNDYDEDGPNIWYFLPIEFIPLHLYKDFSKIREDYWIDYFDSRNNGYNIERGYDTWSKHPRNKQMCDEMSMRFSGSGNPMYGRRGKDSPIYGKPKSEEHKKHLSESNKGIIHGPHDEKWIVWAKQRFSGSGNPMYGKTKSDEQIIKEKRTRYRNRLINKFGYSKEDAEKEVFRRYPNGCVVTKTNRYKKLKDRQKQN